jgi:hypothetical protein
MGIQHWMAIRPALSGGLRKSLNATAPDMPHTIRAAIAAGASATELKAQTMHLKEYIGVPFGVKS